jgi:hypothetical protein
MNGLRNLSKLYIHHCDFWLLIDNSTPPFSVIVEGYKTQDIIISNQQIFEKISNI